MIIACAAVLGVGIWAAVEFCPLFRGSRKRIARVFGQQESAVKSDVMDMLVSKLNSLKEQPQVSSNTKAEADSSPIQLVVL